MLTKIQMTISDDSKQFINYNITSVLHGALMEKLDTKYVDKLHENSIRPYSQSVCRTSCGVVWTVNTLNDEASEKIGKVLLAQDFNNIALLQRKSILKISGKNVFSMQYGDLYKDCYLQTSPQRHIRIEFLTPTAFKSSGKYVNVPTTKFVFQSLLNKYNATSDATKIDDCDTCGALVENSEILGFDMCSRFFYLEGVKIPAFMGRVTIKINGAKQLASLANMLVRYGEFSGVGIKSALGMGAVVLQKNKDKQEKEWDKT